MVIVPTVNLEFTVSTAVLSSPAVKVRSPLYVVSASTVALEITEEFSAATAGARRKSASS